jgi:pimeloyl-ACP methyl ester carboxylesterase
VLSETWIAKWHKLPREAMKAPGDCLFERDDLTDRVAEITCPAIIFHGTADMSIEVAKAQELSERLPGSTGVVLIEGGPHAWNLTHPDQVNGPLLAFLRSL